MYLKKISVLKQFFSLYHMLSHCSIERRLLLAQNYISEPDWKLETVILKHPAPTYGFSV
nr:hypothetical protein Iba_chr11bCG8190 [Ipomoea batatas]GME01298.1 hypothetical protein Iba_scaffold57186CG0010 [Ipomoea batatas]GME05320.1 hypothetical protein Iba_scaffold2753CG0820 [Ipomoea batatas]